MKGKEISKYCVDKLKELGADHSQVDYSHTVKKEMAIEGNKISLLRTVHSDDLSISVIQDKKEGSLQVNKIDRESLDKACVDALEQAKASPEDSHKDIAPAQDAEAFSYGVKEPNYDEMYEKLMNYKNAVKDKYPKIVLRDVNLFHQYVTNYTTNSNGVDFETNNGSYETFSMFTAKDGKNTSSFNYDVVCRNDLNGEFLEWGLTDELLQQAEQQTELKSVPEKFEGDIIVTPLCLISMLSSLTSELKDGKHITGTSLMKGKLGTKVLSDKFSLYAEAISDEYSEKMFVTPDGHKAENMTVFENGVLKSNLLSRYGANKTGQERAKNTGVNQRIASGNKSLQDMIKSVKKGVLLCRFSGGMPASNGDFSGVAKNSFYIEDGEIKYAINETMITGNIIDMFNNIKDISKESVNYGHSIMPWMQSSGFTISGK